MFARASVLSEVKGVRIHSPLGFTLKLEARSSRAYVIDRPMFDRIMFHKAVDSGAIPQLGTSVRSVVQSAGTVKVEVRSQGNLRSIACPCVIGADGYKSVCRREARLPPPKHMLTGIQADLKGTDIEQEFVEVYLGHNIAPGFFAWVIPAGDVARVGLCTWDARDLPATYLRKFLARPEFKGSRSVSTTSGRIPIGPGRSAVGGRILLVGDAACHAKPLSGGGVYTGVRGAELCAEAVESFLQTRSGSALAEYDRLWKDEFGKELSRAFRIRKVFLNLTDKKIDKALRIFAEPDVRSLLENHGDIDYPASLASSVLRLAPKLAQFSPQIIESLL